MKDLTALKEKIRHAGKLSSVVRSMKVLSKVSIHQFERASESTEVYRKVLQQAMQVYLRAEVRSRAFNKYKRSDGKQGYILLGAAHGLCGSFDEDLLQFLEKILHSRKTRGPKILVMGHRISSLLTGIAEAEREYEMPVSVEGITDAVLPLVADLHDWKESNELNGISLIHHVPQGKKSFKPKIHSIMPVDEHLLADAAQKEWPSRTLPKLMSDPESFVAEWIHQYLHLSFFRGIALSLAAEHSSRLTAMSLAENKINERIHELERAYSKARQSAVMAELLDILSGYEVVSEAERKPANP